MRLGEKQLQLIHTHAAEAFPNECVGFLFGKENEEREISLTYPINNSQEGDQRRRFEISPTDYMKAENFALNNNIILLGVYHSHPLHHAIPSEHDRKHAVPYFSYIIVSVDENRLVTETTSWILNDNQVFEQEEIKII